MANAVITVLEADGVTQTDVTVLDVARQAAAASKSVTLATEDKAVLDSLATKLDTVITAVQIIDNSISGSETQVDVVAALPAGTNAIGKLAANSGVDIGDVDVTSIAAGSNRIGTVGIHDGTTLAAVKAASTAPVAADAALVVAISPNSVNANGLATIANSAPVVAASLQYETVAASASDQILGATGAVGDYLEGVLCVVATAATSQVQIKDGNGSAITVLPNAVGAGIGTYYVPLGLVTANATTPGWKITTAAGVSVIGTGKFT